MKKMLMGLSGAAAIAGLVALAGCGGGGTAEGRSQAAQIQIDGSSTVFPITAAVAEEFRAVRPDVRVAVSYSGTGGGFKKFVAKEIDINDASRPIKSSEQEQAQANGIGFIELPVAYDGLTVIANPKNEFLDYLTVEELNTIWKPGSTVKKWRQVRPEWPDTDIRLYGPGHDSGTFDYFTEAIMGESGAMRSDFTASEDDNLIVQGVAGDVGALGYLGYAYFHENAATLRAVPIKGGAGDPVAPSPETINNGTYTPLSRPVFIYVTMDAAARPEVEEFVHFYLENAADLVPDVGYIELPTEAYQLALERFDKRVPGSVFAGGAQVGVTVQDLLSREGIGAAR